MDQRKVKILWVDDDINRLKLQPYLDAFEDKGFKIIKVANPDDVDKAIKSNSDIQCIILDISMPPDNSIDLKASKQGMRTGLVVLKELTSIKSLDHVKKIVFTTANDAEVKDYCQVKDIDCLMKQNYGASTFIKKIEDIIEK